MKIIQHDNSSIQCLMSPAYLKTHEIKITHHALMKVFLDQLPLGVEDLGEIGDRY